MKWKIPGYVVGRDSGPPVTSFLSLRLHQGRIFSVLWLLESLSASPISFLSPWLAPLLSFISRWWIFCMGWSLTSYVCSLPLTSAKQSVGTASAGTTLLERGLVSSACQSPIASKPPSKIWAHDLAPDWLFRLLFSTYAGLSLFPR